MEITLTQSSFRNLQFPRPPLQCNTRNASQNSLLIANSLGFHKYQETSLSTRTGLTSSSRSLFHERTRKRCSVDDERSGLEANPKLNQSLALKEKAMEISTELKGTSVFLVGMDSFTKTNVGKALAEALRYYYFESDDLVEQLAGGESTAQSLLATDEKGFRDSETEVLRQLSSMGRLVVCTGAGAVQSSTNLALIRHGLSIWIDVPLYIIGRGMIEKGSQFAAGNDLSVSVSPEVMTELAEMYERMKDGYATADAKVSLQKVATQLGYDNMDAVTVEDMAIETLEEIEKLTRVKKMMEAAARPF